MKRTLLVLALFFILGESAFGATLTLKATWTPNTEPDMAGYNLYRTDGVRTKINTGLIPFLASGAPTTQYNFTVTVTDKTAGTMKFVLTAVDTGNNESLDSNTASFNYDLVPPAAPGNFSVTKQ